MTKKKGRNKSFSLNIFYFRKMCYDTECKSFKIIVWGAYKNDREAMGCWNSDDYGSRR